MTSNIKNLRDDITRNLMIYRVYRRSKDLARVAQSLNSLTRADKYAYQLAKLTGWFDA